MKTVLNISKIPKNIGYYLSGFVDGEGSFYSIIRKRNDFILGYHFSLGFNVSNRDHVILSLLKKHLGCGTIRERDDGCYVYQVDSFESIQTNVLPFFKKFGFLSSKKKKEFFIFQKMVYLKKKGIITIIDVENFLILRKKLGQSQSFRFTYSDEYILKEIQEKIKKSSETIR
jgi:hypothetical protein